MLRNDKQPFAVMHGTGLVAGYSNRDAAQRHIQLARGGNVETPIHQDILDAVGDIRSRVAAGEIPFDHIIEVDGCDETAVVSLIQGELTDSLVGILNYAYSKWKLGDLPDRDSSKTYRLNEAHTLSRIGNGLKLLALNTLNQLGPKQ
jgi:hypothetical protein